MHAIALVTERMLKQVSKASPRTLQQDLAPDKPLVFSKEEVLELKSVMLTFVRKLVTELGSRA